MTTPADKMNLADTMSNVKKLDDAIKATDAEMKKAYDTPGDAGREMRRSLRDVSRKLQTRRDVLSRSMNHGEYRGREIVRKGNEVLDLGPVK